MVSIELTHLVLYNVKLTDVIWFPVRGNHYQTVASIPQHKTESTPRTFRDAYKIGRFLTRL